MKKEMISLERKKYLTKQFTNKWLVNITRIFILALFISLWEVLARLEIIDSFLMSMPSKIISTIKTLYIEGNLFKHIFTTLYETILGFLIATILGSVIAVVLWWSSFIRKVLEPYIVILNSLPKIALGPIIIVWFGAGSKSIIFMAIIITIIITIINMQNGFLATEISKITLLKSMGANKFQILLKLVLPNCLPTFISTLKINVGMSWIGSIMGEYLVSKQGIGYLIVYGSQVFRLDIVMASTVILTVLAGVMYAIVALIEKIIVKRR